MLFIFCGQDSFSRRETVAEIKRAMGDGEMASLNTVTFDAARLTFEQLAGSCQSAPFFADRRLIIVSGLLTRFEAKERRGQTEKAESREPAKKAAWQPFVECLSNLPPSVDVVLEDDNVQGANPLLKALAKNAKVRYFSPLRPGEVVAWVEKRVRSCGGTISPAAAKLLADSVGNNLWVLASEVDKLLAYRGKARITEEDVDALVSYARDANVFAAVDAIVERKADVASRLVHQLMDEGATPPYLLTMITRQFRILIQAKDLAGQGARPTDIRRILGISSDFVFEKVMKQMRGYSESQLEGVYHSLLQVDIDIKTGKTDQEAALDLLVLDLCHSLPAVRRSV